MGISTEATFLDQSDGEIFLKTLEETCLASGWVIHSFALMRDHYHLLIEIQRATLVAVGVGVTLDIGQIESCKIKIITAEK